MVPPNAVFIIAIKKMPGENMYTIAASLTKTQDEIPLNNKWINGDPDAKIIVTEKKDKYTQNITSDFELEFNKGKWFIKHKGIAQAKNVVKFNILIAFNRRKVKSKRL